MTITETTRRCARCGDLVDAGDKACAKCGRPQCPPVTEWPEGAKRLLLLLVVVDALALKVREAEQLQMEWLLENVVRGHYYQGKHVTFSAAAAECFPMLLDMLGRWKAAGCPTEFAAVAAIRGVVR